MRIKRGISIILIFALAFIIVGCSERDTQVPTLIVDDYNGIDLNMIDHYKIDVEFNPNNKAYSANQEVIYVNNTGIDLDEIYFHLYPNAYKSVETAPILFNNQTLSKEDYIPGYMEIEKIMIGKREVDFKIGGTGDTILKLILPKIIEPKEKINIEFVFNVKLPTVGDRFGLGEDVFNFGNWYPIACVYDETGWNLDPYYSLGDPFYSNISNYNVTITTTKDMVVAASGNILWEKVKGEKKTYKMEGKLIRDFAWVASPNFLVSETEIEGTIIKLYAMENSPVIANYALEVGKDCIEIFNRLYGKYPYGVYSIVMTEFPTGMEYPSIVFINKDYYNFCFKDPLEKVIVHETAHQWWYGVVGNDQIDEAWLDESLATYSEAIYMNNRYGEEEGENYYNYTCEMPYEYGKDYIVTEAIIRKPLSNFHSWEDYGLLVYVKGAMFLNDIKEDFGIEVLYDILNRYYNTYKFYNATTDNFIETCEEVTNTSFQERVDKWLYGK
ncbi:M1 family metallopeptidase [Clostridium sp. Cult2]|uniref:M1 family metallopeptidase n=1 Tax=Clostridium sp. Cult2 TaxID=2079003 RepID=UPI001F4552BA|nr:M1 family metallopeptidase [Clostridium sp. Cult2]MCF6466555.1 agmatine deiminase [Clostridium sp. Cult2]